MSIATNDLILFFGLTGAILGVLGHAFAAKTGIERLRAAAAVLLLASLTHSFLVGGDDSPTRGGLLALLGGLAGGSHVWISKNKVSARTARRCCLAFFVVMAFASAIAAVDVARDVSFTFAGQPRRTGMFSNPNSLGMFLIPALVGAGSLCLRSLHQRLLAGSWTATSAVLFAAGSVGTCYFAAMMAVTYSRGAWLAAAYALTCVVHHYTTPPMRKHLWRLTTVLAPVAFLIIWHADGAQNVFLRRLHSIVDGTDLSWVHRAHALESGIRLILDAPLLGHGVERAAILTEGWFASSSLASGAAILSNDYLITGAWLGSLGLIALLVYIGATFEIARRCISLNHLPAHSDRVSQKPARTAHAALVVAKAYALGALFNSTLYTAPLSLIFWVALHLSCLSPATPPKNDRKEQTDNAFSHEHEPTPQVA